MPSNPSLSWQKLQDVYYSIRTCYEGIKWPMDHLYSNFRIALSSPLTLIATASKFVPYPNVIEIYAINGTKLWSIVYNSTPQDHIVGFCFHHEHLCVVLSNQKFRLYTDFDGTFDEYSYTSSLFHLAQTNGDASASGSSQTVLITNLDNNEVEEPFHVQQSYVWGDYLALRNKDKLTFTNLLTFRNFELKLDGLQVSKQHSVCYLNCTDDTLRFILSYDKTVYEYVVNFGAKEYEVLDQKLTDGPFSIMSASPNGSLIALLNENLSVIFVITKDFDRVLLEYDTSNESSLPYMIEWAGNDAIVLSLRDEIKLIGPAQKSVSYFYDIVEHEDLSLESILSNNSDDLSFVIPLIKCDNDGLKIISKSKVEFLSRVPDCSVTLHLIGSSHPSVILMDCVDKLSLQASKADSNISLLKSENLLEVAIKACLESALEEFLPLLQQKILKAVSFGKIYQETGFDADEYLRVFYTLKVLNQLRSPEIGLFLTHSEVVDAGWNVIIRMLLVRSQHLLALKVVDLLHLEEYRSTVYVDWCQRKIRKELNLSDEDLFVIIARKLLVQPKGGSRQVHFSSILEIFNVSHEEGRINLCKLLVNLEPSGSSRMKQLIRIGETELALIRCFQSCDFDLCKLFFLYFKDTCSALQIFQIINQNEIKMAQEVNTTALLLEHEFLKPLLQENLFVNGDLVGAFFHHTIASSEPELLDMFLKYEGKNFEQDVQALRAYKDEEHEFGEGEDYNDNRKQWCKDNLAYLKTSKKLKKVVEVESELLDLRQRLSNVFQQSFFEQKSVVDIIKKLVAMNQEKEASKVAKEFGISQEKLWSVVVEVCCRAKNFDRLHKFISTANANATVWKSPIGFLPIVEHCLIYNASRELTSQYISYCSDRSYAQRADLYLRNGDMQSAVAEAHLFKDTVLLKRIMNKVDPSDDSLISQIRAHIHELT